MKLLHTISLCLIYAGVSLVGYSQPLSNLKLVIKNNRRIGLVLGGGGAKAAAEIGVLKVLDSLDIRVDYIAGSSMGAVVGGLYASGYTAKQIESLFLEEEWLQLFNKNEMFSTTNFARTFWGRIRDDHFEEMLGERLKCSSFEETEIPFKCTASKIEDNTYLSELVLSEGPFLAKAIHASMSWPAPIVGYKPVDYLGMKLVDGGMLNNLPVDVISENVDAIIAVDLEQKHRNSDEDEQSNTTNELNIIYPWLINWIINHPERKKHQLNVEEAKKTGNIYINPDLSEYDIFSFDKRKMQLMIELGEADALKHIDKLMLLLIN